MNTYIKLFTNELKNKGLSLFDKAVFGSLVTKYQYHNKEAFYTYEAFIADELEISESTVKRSIKTLSREGLITITKKYHKQLKKTVNYYSIPDAMNVSVDETTTPVEIVPEIQNNKPIEQVEQPTNITAIIEQVISGDNDYDNSLKDIQRHLEAYHDECIKRAEHSENYNELNDAIQSEYNQTIEDYFNQFNNMYDLGFARLEHLADVTNLTPEDILSIFKTVKQTA